MTRTSESETRSVEAIGNGRVIPAQAGIQVRRTIFVFNVNSGPGLRRGDEFVR